MNEIMTWIKYYIKVEERNYDKKARDLKEYASGVSDSSQQ